MKSQLPGCEQRYGDYKVSRNHNRHRPADAGVHPFRAEYKLDDAFPEYIGANGILHSFHHRGESDTGIIGRLRVPSDTTSRRGGTSKDVPINKIHGGYIKRRRDRAHEMNIKVIRPVLGRG